MKPNSVIHNPEDKNDILAKVYVLEDGLKYDFHDCLLRDDLEYVKEAIKDIRDICADVNSTCKVVTEGNSLEVFAYNPNYKSKRGKVKMLLLYAYRSLKRVLGLEKRLRCPKTREA